MNDKQKHLLENYQHLMSNDEKMAVRWIVEEWDQENNRFPSWLSKNLFRMYGKHLPNEPSILVRKICLSLLSKHKDKISLPK